MTIQHLSIRCFKKIRKDIWQFRLPLLLIFLYLLVTSLLFKTCCPYAILFGRSCPACGLTRSGVLVLTGHFSEALSLNPTIYLWVPLLLYGLIFRYILDRIPPHYFLLSVITGSITVVWFFFMLSLGVRVPVSFDGILPFIFK